MLARKTPSATSPSPQSSGWWRLRRCGAFLVRFLTRDGVFGRSFLLRLGRDMSALLLRRGDDPCEAPLRRDGGPHDVEPAQVRAGLQVVTRPVLQEQELHAEQPVVALVAVEVEALAPR